MKIFGIGRNYREHSKELDNDPDAAPVVFLMPDTALLKDNAPFYYPDFSNEIHYEVEMVIRINRQGKSIQPAFAHKYFEEIGLGIDFTARDLQREARKEGKPWSAAKGFNNSCPVSGFLPVSEITDINNLNISLFQNGELRQSGNTSDMIWSFHQLISETSRYFMLKKGDLIFTGTPAGVGPVHIGDRLQGYINDKCMLDFEIK